MAIASVVQPLSIPGRIAEPGRRVGVLLSHGFTGSPASMKPWGEALAARGWAVEVPRLPGHGTSWQDMNTTRWQDWYGEVRRAFDVLRNNNDHVVVAGLSMGGSLVLRLAADLPEQVDGVVLVNPAVILAKKDSALLGIASKIIPSMPGVANDIKKPGVNEHGYDRTPLKAALSMSQAWKTLREDLPRVTAPVLFFRSADDHVVDPTSLALIKAGVSSTDFTVRTLQDSYHVATIDNDAELIWAESAEFIERVTGS